MFMDCEPKAHFWITWILSFFCDQVNHASIFWWIYRKFEEYIVDK